MSAMQRNSGTYCDEPDDAGDYAAWLADFDLAARKADIDGITAGNAFMAELQARIVPLIVRYDVFWTRYFYQCAPYLVCPVAVCAVLARLLNIAFHALVCSAGSCLVLASTRPCQGCMR